MNYTPHTRLIGTRDGQCKYPVITIHNMLQGQVKL